MAEGVNDITAGGRFVHNGLQCVQGGYKILDYSGSSYAYQMLFKKNWGDFKFDVKEWDDWFYLFVALVRTSWTVAAMSQVPLYIGTGPQRLVATWYYFYTALAY